MNTTDSLTSIQTSLPYLNSEWVLVATFFIAFIFDVFFSKKNWIAGVSFLGVLISFILLIAQYKQFSNSTSVQLFSGFYQLSKDIIQFKIILGIATIAVFIPFVLKAVKPKSREFFYLIPILLFSANVLCMSNHLLSIFLGIEFLSLVSYLFIAFEIKSKHTAESSTKYILYGAFASAIMLYGITWLYGITGTLQLDSNFLSSLSKVSPAYVAMSLLLFTSGYLFKTSAVPFHFYSPDVYEGSTPSTLAIISTIPKIAGFAILYTFIKHFHFNWEGTILIWPNFSWEKMIAIISIASMFVGNLSALAQHNLKRIFAFSSISHTGFMLLGLLVFSDTGLNALLYYLLVYSFSNIAIFYLLEYWEVNYKITQVSELIGIGKKSPWSSSVMIVLLASFTGLPPLAGFVAKFFVFGSIFQQFQLSQSPWLLFALIAGVLNTVIALFYYFNIARYLFLKKSSVSSSQEVYSILLPFITLLTLLLIVLGLFPGII